MTSSQYFWNVTDVLPGVGTDFINGNSWVLFVVGALVIGIIIGGMMKGLAKVVLAVVLFLGFVILALMVLQKQDLLSMVASVIFGIIMLVSSFLVKLSKTYPIPKR